MRSVISVYVLAAASCLAQTATAPAAAASTLSPQVPSLLMLTSYLDLSRPMVPKCLGSHPSTEAP